MLGRTTTLLRIALNIARKGVPTGSLSTWKRYLVILLHWLTFRLFSIETITEFFLPKRYPEVFFVVSNSSRFKYLYDIVNFDFEMSDFFRECVRVTNTSFLFERGGKLIYTTSTDLKINSYKYQRRTGSYFVFDHNVDSTLIEDFEAFCSHRNYKVITWENLK